MLSKDTALSQKKDRRIRKKKDFANKQKNMGNNKMINLRRDNIHHDYSLGNLQEHQ